MEIQDNRPAPRTPRPRQAAQRSRRRRKSRAWKYGYLLFLGVLLIAAVGTLFYVRGALAEYESSQPDTILQKQMESLRAAAAQGRFEEVFPLDSIRTELGATEEEIAQFQSDFLNGTVTFREDHSSVDASKKVFDVICDGCKVANFTLKHISQETKLLIFTLDHWQVEGFQATGYEVSFQAPASAIVKSHGQTVQGTPSQDSGQVSYSIRSLSKPEVTIEDVLGNSVPYDRNKLPTFTQYKIVIPSNFTIVGKQPVPITAATLEGVDALKYVKEYCDAVPDLATYVISTLSENPEFQILDGYGEPVEFTVENRKVTLTEQVGRDTLSLNVDFDPLEVAKMWSNFMTRDLSGGTNGFDTMAAYLINGSYLRGVAKSWATGVDITFTSSHTLENPPFHTQQISDYVVYSENCFSCQIKLGKTMHLTRTGDKVEDEIYGTFYFVKYDDTDNGISDPHWTLVDYREIQEGGTQ